MTAVNAGDPRAGDPRATLTIGDVLTHLRGFPQGRNYDGSWTEWGNSGRVPITRGDKP